jgi:hypothetical protein
MKALLLRDLRAYRTFFLLLITVMILYSLLIFQVGSVNGLVGFLVVFLPSIAGIVLFLGDQELMQHTASLPISRTQLVVAKYLSTYLFGSVLVILTIAITWLFSGSFFNARVDFLELISIRGFLFSILPITVIVSISYPVLFRYGLGLGAKILLVGFALLYGLGMIVMERVIGSWLMVERSGIFTAAMALFARGEARFGVILFDGGLMALLLTLVIGSVALSVYWINRKDFN